MRATFDERRKEMVRRLQAIPDTSCAAPDGAFYAFPDLHAFLGRRTRDGRVLDDDVALCTYLVDVGNVALVPGSGFGAPGFARLSYACSMDDIRRGVDRIGEALSALT
jgi:aspartate aminotransferase